MKKSLFATMTLAMAVTPVISVEAAEKPLGKEITKTMTQAEITAFFEQHGPYAAELSMLNNVYASVILAQMALESSYGRSALAQPPANNYFGIKGTYNGDYVLKSTLEDDGKGNMSTIIAQFKAYPTYKDSMNDNVNTIKKSIYKGAWMSNTTSYEDATRALQGVYATDTSYASKLNKLIKENNLTFFDKSKPSDYTTVPKYSTHTVVSGDSLYRIGLTYGITADEIMTLNGLTSTSLRVGQVLKVYTNEIVYSPSGYVARTKIAVQSTINGNVTHTIPSRTNIAVLATAEDGDTVWAKIIYTVDGKNHIGWTQSRYLMKV